MRYGIISDIHSNLEALNTSLDFLKFVDKIICLGDIVGYGANPNECVELIKKNDVLCVKGNHDAVITGELSLDKFNEIAYLALKWTMDKLTDENKKFLKGSNLVEQYKNLVFCHGSLEKPENINYVFDEKDIATLKYVGEEIPKWDICFIGHTHAPIIAKVKDKEHINLKEDISYLKVADLEFNLELKGYKHIVNVGSVGQPRDWDWRSCYFTYDSENQRLEYHRVEYELAKAQRKIVDAGLPVRLAKRLEIGR
jgi:putative phosphoesterase|tara:strand:- start:574 stop:1335 length:762 start_codon:yes stop_codon:yes gene_type:complete